MTPITVKLNGLVISLKHYTLARRSANGAKEILRKASGGPNIPAYLVNTGHSDYQPAASAQLAWQAFNRALSSPT